MPSQIRKSPSCFLRFFLCAATALLILGFCTGFAYAADAQQTPNLAAGSVNTASDQVISGVPFEGAGMFYIATCNNPEQVLGMLGNDRTNYAQVIVSGRKNTNLLKFNLICTGNRGEYYIQNVATGRLLSADATGSNAIMQTNLDLDSQKWAVTVNSDNTVSFLNVFTKTMLAVSGDYPVNGAYLCLQQANVNNTQRFSLVYTKLKKNEKVQIKVPCKMQNPQLPTGCESVALVNALNYWGFHLSKTSIAKKWMPYGRNGVYNFIGNPWNSTGWIICAPGIAKTANKFLKSKNSNIKAMVVKGKSLKSLRKFIDQGYPVIVWTTIGMGDPGRLSAYRSGYPLRHNNHAVVLCGYNPKNGKYKVADSLRGTVWRNGKRFTYLYNKMGKQAVVLYD